MDQPLCKTCNQSIDCEWRIDKSTIKKNPLIYCSRRCSNSRGKRSEEVRNKIANTLKQKPRTSTPVQNSCIVCGNVFETSSSKRRRTCNKTCKNYLHSLKRQEYIKEHGSFSTLRETFTYKSITIVVDSNLEKAGIVYLTDVLGAIKIERFYSILNFWEGDAHRTFNPDFICRLKNGRTALVEVKQKWIQCSNHDYNRTIPLKKKALEEYCKAYDFDMLWLDFDNAQEMKQIYKQILVERNDK
jgi:predicted  nucleic acid-binding Zn-ribbon protein